MRVACAAIVSLLVFALWSIGVNAFFHQSKDTALWVFVYILLILLPGAILAPLWCWAIFP